MKTPSAISSRAFLATLLVVATTSTAFAQRELYQWVDGSGNVMYGDSPPSVTHSRTVDPVVSDGPLRQLPGDVGSGQADAGEPTPTQKLHEQAALVEALGRLEAVMSKMQALTEHVDRLEQEKQVLQTRRDAQPADRPTPPAVESAPAVSPPATVAVTSREPAPALPPVAVQPSGRHPQSSTATTVASPKSASEASAVTSAQARAPHPDPREAAISPEPAGQPTAALESDTRLANLEEPRLDSEALIGPQPLLEVAVPEPQPIKSQMTAKERDRSRWQSQNRAQQRFLERLTRNRAENSSD